MKYDLTEKKAWITPGIEEAPVQATEALKWTTETERLFRPWTWDGGAEEGVPDGGDEPGGPS
jgi:hypothetical protein